MSKADFVRKCCVAAYNMDLDTYERVFGNTDRWWLMSSNFTTWYCKLDSGDAEKFIKYVEGEG